MIQIHIFDKDTGEYLYTDIGNAEYVINDLGNDKDFTLTAPPDNSKQWRWINGKWEYKMTDLQGLSAPFFIGGNDA